MTRELQREEVVCLRDLEGRAVSRPLLIRESLDGAEAVPPGMLARSQPRLTINALVERLIRSLPLTQPPAYPSMSRPPGSLHSLNSESFRELRACPERRRTGQSSLRSRYGGVGSPLPMKPIRSRNKSALPVFPAGRFELN